jgi:hypothetical protein
LRYKQRRISAAWITKPWQIAAHLWCFALAKSSFLDRISPVGCKSPLAEIVAGSQFSVRFPPDLPSSRDYLV